MLQHPGKSRAWLIVFTISNSLALVDALYWFPVGDLDLFEDEHVMLAMASCGASLSAALISAGALLRSRHEATTMRAVTALQIVAVLLAVLTVRFWSGAGGGGKIGWSGFVVPVMGLTAFAGLARGIWIWTKRKPSLPPRRT